MEVCVDSLESSIAAYEGNANRIELCSSLNEGGLTPSFGLLRGIQNYVTKLDTANQAPLAVNCMVRCRVGDFNYSDMEVETMHEDLKKFIELGVDGVVFGALTEEGHVDEGIMKEFLNEIPASSGIKTTFHRAFDVCADWRGSFEQIAKLGFDKILTSGQEATAYEGRFLLKELVELSRQNTDCKSVHIIAGAGINKSNLKCILEETRCHEFHASCRSSRFSKMKFKNTKISMGSPQIDEFETKFTDRLKCQELSAIYKDFLNY